MADENGPPLDLLGDPWQPPRDPRGRKRHKRDRQVAETIAVLRASGMLVENIAARVGLSEPTLRKYYFRELDAGPSLAKAVLTEAMWKSAKKGNVSAARFLREEFDKGEVAVPVARRAPAAPKEEKLGKKASADRDAQTAHEDSEWADVLH